MKKTKQMKKTLTLLALIVSQVVSASHLLGGMIAVAQTSYDSTSVGMYLISDSQGVPLPSSITVEKWEMNSVGWYVQNGTVTLTQGAAPMSFQGQTLTNYVSAYLDLDSNKYRFIYRNCCWGNLSNSSNSFNSEFIISTDYWHIPYNSTSFANAPLWINVQKDTLNSMKPIWGNFNCFLSQFDNDSVNVTQADLYSGYANGVFVPQIHNALNMHVSNDSISWTPTALGSFGTGFHIDEYRNGQLIGTQRAQWTFIVRTSTIGIEEREIEKEVIAIYDTMGRLVSKDINDPWLNGLHIVHYNTGFEKIFLVR